MDPRKKESYWACDECTRNICHGEYRYNCTVCPHYDFCEKCMASVNPPHPHRMTKELAYGTEQRKECMRIDMATGLRAAMAMYWDRHCFGVRDVDKDDPSIYTDSYSWLTFKTVGDRAKNFGHGLRQLIKPHGYLAICSHNRPEWMITDFACMLQGIISVPIYRLFSEREIIHVINNTQVSVVVCDGGILARFVQVMDQCPTLRHIVCMDPIENTICSKCDFWRCRRAFRFLVPSGKNEVSIHCMGNIENRGLVKQYDYVTVESEDCLTIIYTSGSSGFPKGAMMSESAFRANFPHWCLPSSNENVFLSYRSLAWASDREAIIALFLMGGRTGFATGDHARLMEELAIVRPTYFGGTPAIWNKIYTEFQTAFALTTAHLPSDAAPAEEQRLLEQFSQLIPNRTRGIAIGGAMCSSAVKEFMKRCFAHCNVNEAYGITECGSITFRNDIESTVQYRLESVPELGYTVDDQPYPRGELLAKTTQMFSGYINDPLQTADVLTDDGFFRTGDIVELRPSSTQPQIYVIDRKKNFFKLAQGQFIAPEYLQSLFIQSAFIDQIFIHADLISDTLTAVVVPNRDNTQLLTSSVDEAILADLRSIGEKESLRPHEIPSRLIIDFQPFTPENGLLTSSMKLCRYKLAAHYAQQLKSTASTSVQQRLRQIIESVRGTVVGEQETSLISSGTDSLSTVRLSKLIEKDLGISVPLHILFDPNITLQQLTDLIQHPSQLQSFSSSTFSQLTDEYRWDPPSIAPNQRKVSAIFITGTTGFVGAFLLAELLRVYPPGCRMICLVRCDPLVDPFHRLRQTLISYQIWNPDDEHRLTALRGDLSQSSFGLDAVTFQSLIDQVNVIFHCAANVNFILSAHQLAKDNVFGTREVLRLATSHPSASIPVHFISTLSVLSSSVGKSGYAQTKWMAESLVSQAIQAGLSAKIYRLGLIGPHSRSGIGNPRDLYTLLFTAMLQMHCYPSTLRQGHLTVLPVDVTASSIVHLSQLSDYPADGIHQLIDRRNRMPMANVIEGLHQCDKEMRMVENDEWEVRVQRLCDEKSEFECVKKFLLSAQFGERDSDEDVALNEQYEADVSRLDLAIIIDKDYAHRWVKSIWTQGQSPLVGDCP